MGHGAVGSLLSRWRLAWLICAFSPLAGIGTVEAQGEPPNAPPVLVSLNPPGGHINVTVRDFLGFTYHVKDADDWPVYEATFRVLAPSDETWRTTSWVNEKRSKEFWVLDPPHRVEFQQVGQWLVQLTFVDNAGLKTAVEWTVGVAPDPFENQPPRPCEPPLETASAAPAPRSARLLRSCFLDDDYWALATIGWFVLEGSSGEENEVKHEDVKGVRRIESTFDYADIVADGWTIRVTATDERGAAANVTWRVGADPHPKTAVSGPSPAQSASDTYRKTSESTFWDRLVSVDVFSAFGVSIFSIGGVAIIGIRALFRRS